MVTCRSWSKTELTDYRAMVGGEFKVSRCDSTTNEAHK